MVDRTTVHIVVGSLGALAIAIVIGGIWRGQLPEPMWGLGGSALGALAALLTNVRTSGSRAGDPEGDPARPSA